MTKNAATQYNPTSNRHNRLPRRDMVVLFDDFLGDTFATDSWLGAADGGATTPAITVVAGGAVLLAAATDDDVSEFSGPIAWKPSLGGLYFETRIQLSAITTTAACVGLFDAAAYSATMPITLTGTTFTTNATSGVGIVFDTDATTDVWYGIGVKAGTDTASVALAAPVAATYETLGVGVDSGGTAYFYQNGDLIGSKANAVTTTTLLAPYVGLQTRVSSSRTMTCDYVLTTAAR